MTASEPITTSRDNIPDDRGVPQVLRDSLRDAEDAAPAVAY